MTPESAERFRRLLPRFDGSRFIAVFNCTDYGVRKARERIIKEFGRNVYDKEVKAKMKTGIMEIFHHKPTRALRRFAWYVALNAERYHSKKE